MKRTIWKDGIIASPQRRHRTSHAYSHVRSSSGVAIIYAYADVARHPGPRTSRNPHSRHQTIFISTDESFCLQLQSQTGPCGTICTQAHQKLM